MRSITRLFVTMAVVMPLAVQAETAAHDPNLGCERASSAVVDSNGMPTPEQILAWIEDLANFGYRRQGAEALRQAEEYIRCHFETLGMSEVYFEESSAWQWEAEKWGLAIEGRSFDCYPAHHSFITPGEASEFSTGPGGLEAAFVDVGRGRNITPERVAGKIAVFDLRFLIPSGALLLAADFWWDPGYSALKEPRALFQANPYLTNLPRVIGELMDAGAVGFVGILADYFDSNKYYNEYYRRQEFTIPGVWVTHAEGAQIRRLMRGTRGDATGTLRLEGFRRQAPARSVFGILPGNSLETIQVQSHHDATWDGAVQDGSGVASLLALAHYFAAQPAHTREKTLMFTTFSSHWTGYQAHQDFVEKYIERRESPYEIVANVTVEHIAKHGTIDRRTRALVISEQPEPRGILNTVSFELATGIAEAVKEHGMRRTVVMRPNLLGMPTDASFIHEAGVPVVSLISGPVYLYDKADTLDKVPVDELGRVPQAMADIIRLLDATPSDQIGDDGRLAAMRHGEFDRMMGGWMGRFHRWAPLMDWLVPSR